MDDIHWGDGSIRPQDAEILKYMIGTYHVKTVVEFGPGTSTLIMYPLVEQIVSYETNTAYIELLLRKLPDADVRGWDGLNADIPKADMVFIDGPSAYAKRGGREHSFRLAVDAADIIVVHDAGRKHEQECQAKYLIDDFELLIDKNTSVWIRKGTHGV